MAIARQLWHRLETLHAVTYFSEESRTAAKETGLKGFWMGYFGFRAAPMGEVSAGTVMAMFANFEPTMVERSVPDAWSFASPADLLATRSASAATALRSIISDIAETAALVGPALESVVDEADGEGRPLFEANRNLTLPEDPVERLWQLATTLREHRGDIHVQVLGANGLGACEAHQLHAAEHGTPIELLRDNRGWSEEIWDRSTASLRERGLLDENGITAEGLAVRSRIESSTDRLAGAPIRAALSAGEQSELLATLTPAAVAVADSGVIPFPNPMGLPHIARV